MCNTEFYMFLRNASTLGYKLILITYFKQKQQTNE